MQAPKTPPPALAALLPDRSWKQLEGDVRDERNAESGEENQRWDEPHGGLPFGPEHVAPPTDSVERPPALRNTIVGRQESHRLGTEATPTRNP